MSEDVNVGKEGGAHSHEDGPGHGDGVEGVEDGGEEVHVESGFKTESPKLSRVRDVRATSKMRYKDKPL